MDLSGAVECHRRGFDRCRYGQTYEAGSLDSATGWKKFSKLTFPLIIPFFSINMVLCIKNFLMVFDQIMALTKGGPAQSTESISYLIYNNGMKGGQFSFQSANAVVFLILGLSTIAFPLYMTIMLYSGYLVNIPFALEEATRVDGASAWRTYWKVIFPLMRPMYATVAVITSLAVWNDVMPPLVIMAGSGVNTLPLAQMNFQSQFGTNYNLAFAAYLLALIPIFIFYLICQRQIINGVVNGAVK